MSEAAAKRYAEALFDVVQSRGTVDQTERDLETVHQALLESDDLRKVLTHPRVSKEKKKALLATIFKEDVSQEVLNLLKVIVDRGREAIFVGLKGAFTAIADEARGIVEMTVTTAQPLTKEEEDKLVHAVSSHLGKQLRVRAQVDPNVIGGVLIKIGNRLYDGTLAGKLNRFSQALKASR